MNRAEMELTTYVILLFGILIFNSLYKPCSQESKIENSKNVDLKLETVEQRDPAASAEQGTLKQQEQSDTNAQSGQQQQQLPPQQQQQQQQQAPVPSKEPEKHQQEGVTDKQQAVVPEHVVKVEENVPVLQDEPGQAPTPEEVKDAGLQAPADADKTQGKTQKEFPNVDMLDLPSIWQRQRDIALSVDEGDETTGTNKDSADHANILESVVDETINAIKPLPANGPVNVNIINVFVDVDVVGGDTDKSQDKPQDKPHQPTVATPTHDTQLEPPATEDPEPKEPVRTTTEPPSEPLEKIPSFDEWKQKQLAAQAEQEKSKQLEAAAGNTPTNGSPTKNKSNKRMANFAALTCGAKLLSTNPEARNPGSVLTENKDQYMIQPCKVKKWFIIELCEPVQVRNLEIANLELFSSLPESFVAHISDRYPTKEWKALGTFHAREERTVQSFSVGDVQMFAKYIKIEMLSHYGNEHYCPLSIIRVFGTTVEEDYEDSDQPEEPHTEEDILSDSALQQQAGTDESSNLFDSAKDTVLSIVKNVLNTNDEDNQKAVDELEKIVSNNATINSTLNATVANTTSQQDQSKPCTPNPSAPDSPSQGTPVSKPTEPSTPSAHTVTGTAEPNQLAPDSSNTPIVTKLDSAHHESHDIMEELVILIERPQISLQNILQRCNFCQRFKQSSCYFDQTRTCGYYKTLHFIYPTSCVQKLTKTDAKIQLPKSDQQSEDTQPEPNHSEEPAQKSEEISSDTSFEQQTLNTDKIASKTDHVQIVPTPVLPTSDQAANPDVTDQESVVKPSTSVGDETTVQEKAAMPSSTASETMQTESADKKEDTQPSEKSNYNECVQKGGTVIAGSGDLGSSCTMGPDVVDVRPSTPSKAVPEETEVNINTETPVAAGSKEGEEVDKVQVDSQPETQNQKQQQQIQPDKGVVPQEGVKVEQEANGMKNIYAEEPLTDPNDIDLDSLPVPDNLEEPIQKLSSKNKETAFMRLKNRIKELELNLNLSSRYLEELSKNYKRQMEDMYTSLNKTISKLTDTSKSAETRDLRQQEYIKKLEIQVGNLTSEVALISNSINNIHKDVIERHLFLMCIEAVLFLALFSFCIGWRRRPYIAQPAQPQTALTSSDVTKSQVQRKSSKVKLIKDFPNKPKEDKKLKKIQQRQKRRNSFDGTPPRPRGSQTVITPVRSVDDLAIRLSVSEDTITIIEPTIPAFSNPSPQDKQWDVVKQKKKKKKHQKKLSWGGDKSIYLTDSFNNSPVSGSTIETLTLETLSNASSGSLSSNGDSEFRTDCVFKDIASYQTTNTAQTKPTVNGTRRSLDVGPISRPQNRRSSDQMKQQNTKHLINGNVSNSTTPDSGQVKINGFENQLSKLKSKSNGTIKDLSASCTDGNKTRGFKHWFPGIKNTVS